MHVWSIFYFFYFVFRQRSRRRRRCGCVRPLLCCISCRAAADKGKKTKTNQNNQQQKVKGVKCKSATADPLQGRATRPPESLEIGLLLVRLVVSGLIVSLMTLHSEKRCLMCVLSCSALLCSAVHCSETDRLLCRPLLSSAKVSCSCRAPLS